MIRIDTTDGTPIYRQIIEQVKLMVMSGQQRPGDQLESVSSLAARLKVNPMTISKAYGVLVSEGVAERRKGVGIFVAAVSQKKVAGARQKVLNESLREAAGLVVQLDVPRQEAVDLFNQHIDHFAHKKGSRKS